MRAWRHASAFQPDELVVVVLPVADTTSQVWWKAAGRRMDEGTSRPLDQTVRSADVGPRLRDMLPAGWRPDVLVVFRSYMAPVGLRLAQDFQPGRTVLDLDEDDVAVLEALGSPDAPLFEVRTRATAPQFSVVTVASEAEERAVVDRYGLERTAVVPNGVEIPAEPLDYSRRSRSVAMVGNFTYPPNVRGAEWLRDQVWPHLSDMLGEPCALRVVGRGIGEVDDLEPVYRAAAVMAVPLFHGGGTRLKVLEAWALGRPIVSTTIGVAGLGVVPGREALVADDSVAFAEALVEVLLDPALGDALIAAGRQAVERFGAERVQAALRGVAFPEAGR
jgi:hypothetical protein